MNLGDKLYISSPWRIMREWSQWNMYVCVSIYIYIYMPTLFHTLGMEYYSIPEPTSAPRLDARPAVSVFFSKLSAPTPVRPPPWQFRFFPPSCWSGFTWRTSCSFLPASVVVADTFWPDKTWWRSSFFYLLETWWSLLPPAAKLRAHIPCDGSSPLAINISSGTYWSSSFLKENQ
jgi:hypothetical protein